LTEEHTPEVIVFSGKLSEKAERLEPVFVRQRHALAFESR
jgi:hypothetical protein